MRAKRTISRLLAALGVLPAMIAAPGAVAYADEEPGVYLSVRHATFQGVVGDGGTSGEAGDHPYTVAVEQGSCTEAGSSGLSCSVTWKLDDGVSLCAVAPNAPAGIGSYTNSQGWTVDVRLFGAGSTGSGVLEGTFQQGMSVFQMHVDAGDVCGAMALYGDVKDVKVSGHRSTAAGLTAPDGAGRFTGWMDWI